MRRFHPVHNPHPLHKLGFILGGTVLFALGSVLLWIALTPTPDLSSFESRLVTQSTKIYDRTGTTVLYDLSRDAKRSTVPLTDIAPNVRNATVAIEDEGFYQHGGISITGIIRSFVADITQGGLVQGGSTITQQVVKNTLLTGEKSFVRKIHEWILAIKLEQVYTKDQILEFYLNETPYGGPYYGVETASEAFFGKSAKDVDLAESAYLAALPQAPSYYSPYGNNRAALDARKNLVLEKMKEQGYISDKEYAQAKAEVVTFRPQQSGSIIAPHFVFYIEQYLEDTYGPAVVQSGLKVVTTLDTDLQADAEKAIDDYADTNMKKFNATNESLVAMDPKTGQILAMVGSKDYFDTTIDGNFNTTLADRQPGSSFKIFVYAEALLKGLTPQTVTFDLPTQFSTACAPTDTRNDTPPCYAPKDYDGSWRGPMTLSSALGQSINIPAVKLLYFDGIQNVIDLATAAGITTLQPASHYGLPLALGAAEVTLVDMTDAYGTFANEGVHNPPTGILSVTDASGDVLEEYTPHPTQVIDAGVTHDISMMLSDNAARQPEFPPNSPLYFPDQEVAVKTGTTNDFRDGWTIGYTPDLVVGAWAGNNNNSPMKPEIAGFIVAPFWHEFMAKALQKYPQEFFGAPRPSPDNPKPIQSGQYMTENGPHDLLYFFDRNNPDGPSPGNGSVDPQYHYWEYPVQLWAASTGASYGQ
jgi:1A family penicillin-binding protein